MSNVRSLSVPICPMILYPQFSKAVEGLNAEMLWTMMYIYGNLDYPVVVVSDLRIKSNLSLGKCRWSMKNS